MNTQNNLQNECNVKMNAQEIINKAIGNSISFNLSLLEDANFSNSQVQMVRKMLWKVHNDTVKLMNECENDKSNNNKN